ncbi:Transmembrane protein 177 [Anthophora quadrimaculata]
MFFKSVVIVAATATQLLPHSLFINKYRKLRARYGFDDREIPIQKNIKQRCKEVLDDVKLSESDRQRIQFFNVHDIDVFHAGSIRTKHGAIIGIPANFQYQNINNINDQTITIQNVLIDWDTNAGKQFQHSLILSENAQKFALAQRVLIVKQFDVFYQSIAMLVDSCLGITAYEIIHAIFKLDKQRKINRFFYMIIIAFGTTFCWLLTKDAIQNYRELQVNEELAKLGPQYIQGGAEYYEKLSERNKALRILLGNKGKQLFTHNGNESSLFRQKRLPISQQVDYFNSKLQDIQIL